MTDESTSTATQPLERRLATILCADVAGYSQMMGANEERTVRVFRGHREIFESLVKTHRGRIFNTAGDALLAEFNSAVEAVRCATEIQAALRTRNEHLAAEERMQFRIGINLGDVIIQGGDLLGDGVNVAARIQAATEPGGICISGSVHDQIQNKLSLDFKLLGEQSYKNIAKPVRTYTINEGGAVTTARRAGWRVPAAVAAVVLIAAGGGYWGYERYEAQRADRLRIEAQLAAQKLATEQAQRAAEDAKREAQAQLQKQAAEESLRRAQAERSKLEQDRKLLEVERRAAAAAQKQAEAEAQRRAQEERERIEQQRKALEGVKLAAEAAKKQAASQRAAPVAPALKPAAPLDGSYSGQLCNRFQAKAPECWPVALLVRNGIAEGTWISRTQKTATARGTVASDGAVQFRLTTWTPGGTPVEAILRGRVVDGAIKASGRWSVGGEVTGDWKRRP